MDNLDIMDIMASLESTTTNFNQIGPIKKMFMKKMLIKCINSLKLKPTIPDKALFTNKLMTINQLLTPFNRCYKTSQKYLIVHVINRYSGIMYFT